tara:strand:+ start:557 stop:1051 length:495 start_codon:yes stop_codon:yes gene_type:complete
MKTCTRCLDEKDKEDFYKRSRSPDGRESWCKLCRLAHNRAWAENNRDKHHELTRKWYRENKELHLANSKARYNANPAAALARSTLRDDRIKRATPAWADLKAIAYVYTVSRAINEVFDEPWEVDHIYPLQGKTVSGLHVAANLQIITQAENRTKGNKIDESYLL